MWGKQQFDTDMQYTSSQINLDPIICIFQYRQIVIYRYILLQSTAGLKAANFGHIAPLLTKVAVSLQPFNLRKMIIHTTTKPIREPEAVD